MKKIAWGAAAGVAVAMLVGQTMPVKAPFTVSKETTAVTAPVREDGTVDYVAALNAKFGAGVTPENNGFVLWLQVIGTGDSVISPKARKEFLKLCGAQETAAGAEVWESYPAYMKRIKGLGDNVVPPLSDDVDDARRRLWKAADHSDLAAFIESREKMLATVADAVKRPKWWMPPVAGDGRTLERALLPSSSIARDVANVLSARAMLRADSGDVNGFISDISVLRRLARNVASGPSPIERLVGVALDAMAIDSVGTVAASGILNAEQSKWVRDSVESFSPMPSMSEAVDVAERWSQLDILAEIAVGHLNVFAEIVGDPENDVDNTVKSLASIDRSAVDWDAVLKMNNAMMDEVLGMMRDKSLREMLARDSSMAKQMGQWRADLDARVKAGQGLKMDPGEGRNAYTQRVVQGIMALFFPEMIRSEELSRRDAAEVDMVRVLLAAAEAKAKTGHWPATMDELTPGILKELPTDMYSAEGKQPFRYLVKQNGPRVYSVGPNGKDDGGERNGKEKDDIGLGAK